MKTRLRTLASWAVIISTCLAFMTVSAESLAHRQYDTSCDPGTLEEVREMLKNERPEARVVAYRMLLKVGTAEDRNHIVSLLDKEIDALAEIEDWRELGGDFQPQEMISMLCGDALPESFGPACELLNHRDKRIVGEAVNTLIHAYPSEVGPALDETRLDHLAKALLNAIGDRPKEQGGTLPITLRHEVAVWLHHQYNLLHMGWNHRRIDVTVFGLNPDDEQKEKIVASVVSWFQERAEMQRQGELAPDQRRPHDAGIALTGRVLDKPDGRPVKGVTVTLQARSDQSKRQTVTSEDGVYVFEAVPSIGTAHVVQVGEHGPGIWTEDTYLHVPTPDKRIGMTKIDVDDLYNEHPCTVKGVVTDAETGKGIPGYYVGVSTSNRGSTSFVTDENGAYRIHTVSQEVTVECDGDMVRYYGPVGEAEQDNKPLGIRTVKLKPGQTIEGIDFKLQPAPAYSMRLVMPNGKPAVGVPVHVSKMYSMLEPILQEGHFRSFGSIGNWDILVTDQDGWIRGHLRSLHGAEQRASIEITVMARTKDLQYGFTQRIKTTTDDPPPTELRLEMVRCGTAEFRVVDPDEKVIRDATIGATPVYQGHNYGGSMIEQTRLRFVPLEDGRFRASGLIPGWEYELRASAEGYRALRGPRINIDPGEHKVADDVQLDWWGPKAVPGLIEKLRSPEPRDRESACRLLSALGPDAAEAVAELTKVLELDPKNTVRYNAATALGDIGHAALPAVPKLMHALEHDGSGVDREAAIALGKINSPKALPLLIRMKNHDDRDTRNAVIHALAANGSPEAIAELLESLQDNEVDPKTKVVVIKQFQELAVPGALPVLRTLTDHQTRILRETAEEAIRVITHKTRNRVG